VKPRERVWAALSGARVDRPPVSFWGHVYHRESSARDLAEATLEAHRAYGWDWVKLNPRKHYHVEPWGVSYRYSGRPGEKPVLESWPVHAASDWAAIGERGNDAAALAEQIDAVRLVRAGVGADVPLIETVFTPLAVLGEMVEHPQELREHMRTHPALVRAALEAVTATYERFARAVLAAGADGIYLATVDWASRDLMSAADYAVWGRPFDLRVLAAARGAPFHVLHVCKPRNLLLDLADYPVSAFSWDAAAEGNPSLAEGAARTHRAVMGGMPFDASIASPDPEGFAALYRRGLDETGGQRWLVAPGCSIPPTASPANLGAVRDAVFATRLAEDPLS
jgi:uroporphyrinogen decarboxylase